MIKIQKYTVNYLNLALFSLLPLLSGCASVVNGSQEKILVYSKPEGAKCKIYQGGLLQKAFETPHRLVIQRSREQDLRLNCVKAGYHLSAQSWEPDVQNAAAGDAASLVTGIAMVPWWIFGAFTATTINDSEHQSAYGYPKYIDVDLRHLKKGEALEDLPETFKNPDLT
ncbi:hypothetical protein FAI41_03280 [Acetobacteraceae bacterium]|nr:hypothetical protein FAI41_03280 [Acetobacteraceae bacterium]